MRISWRRMCVPVPVLALVVLAFGIPTPESAPVSAGTSDEYFIYSSFDPPGISDVVAAGGYVEYYGVPEWGDEIQYVYFLSGSVGYKVRVWITDGDDDGVIEPRQHPDHYLSAYQGPIEPRHFEIVSSADLSGYTAGSGGHAEEFHIDSSGVYLGAYPNGIHKWDHDWNYLGKVANSPPGRTESLAYNAAENVWYAGGRHRTIYQLSDTDNDGSFLDESWVAIFTYPSYGGSHHDGMEYVGGYLWISDMTSDVIGKWQYDPATSTWVELKRFTYTQPGDVEGMGFGPNDHFWCGSGWGSGSYVYELGNEITRGYPIASTGPDVDAHPPTIAVEFDASGSHHTDPLKEIVLYEWDFESDGAWDSSGTDLVVEHAYPAYYRPDGSIDWDATARDYTATLRVTDNSDPPLTDTDTRIVHITAPPWKPVADAGGPYRCWAGPVCIPLDGSGSYDPESTMFPPDHPWYETIASYEWDLDYDGEFDDSSDVNPMWDCDRPTGAYIVGLRVTDSEASGPGGTVGPLDVAVDYTTVVVEELLDSDGDGIPDAQDACPDEPEDIDGFQDEDGCPEAIVDVSITKGVTDDQVTNLDTFLYFMDMENLGDTDATDVVVEDTLPAEVRVTDGPVASQGSCTMASERTFRCELGTIAPEETAGVALTVEALCVEHDITVRNMATVTAAEDANPTNNTSSVTTVILADRQVCREKLAGTFRPILILGEGQLCPPDPDEEEERLLGFGTRDPYDPTTVETMLAPNDARLMDRRVGRDKDLLERAPTAQDLWDVQDKGDGVYIDVKGLKPGGEVEQCLAYAERYTSSVGRDKASYAYINEAEVANGALFITYWFFYFYNDFDNQHEGDWEHITLKFRSDEDCSFVSLAALVNKSCDPEEAEYSRHGLPTTHPWNSLDRDDSRPISYVGRGSHANFTRPGPNCMGREVGNACVGKTDYAPYDPLGTFQPGPGDPTLEDNQGRRFDVYDAALLPCDATVLRTSQFAWLVYGGHWGQDFVGLGPVELGKAGPTVDVCKTP